MVYFFGKTRQIFRSGFKTPTASKIKFFVTAVNSRKPFRVVEFISKVWLQSINTEGELDSPTP